LVPSPQETFNENRNRRVFTISECLAAIENESGKNGRETFPYHLWSFDGYFFRLCLSVATNEEILGYAGKMLEKWRITDFFPVVAIFVSQGHQKRIHLIRERGQDVSSQNRYFEHDSFNDNPSNDQQCVDELRIEFRERS
jgi:hypothetical protein